MASRPLASAARPPTAATFGLLALALGVVTGAFAVLADQREAATSEDHARAGDVRALTDTSGPSALDPTLPATFPGRHIVAPGESLGVIAQRYGVSPRALAAANGLAADVILRPGDVLLLPDPTRERPPAPSEALDAAPEIAALLQMTAASFGVPPDKVKAVAWQESRWNQASVSQRGAIGIMQVRPATGAFVSDLVGRELDLYDLHDNVVAGVAYLDWLHGVYDGDTRRVLAAYYQGPERLDTDGVLAETDRYIDDVLAWQEAFATAMPAPAAR